MREFLGHEYVDGDIVIRVREEGQDDSAWEKVGTVRFGARRQIEQVATSLGLIGMTSTELARLGAELHNPRRW